MSGRVLSPAKALQTIVNEWNEMRTLFKSAAQSEGGFVIDINRSIGDMAAEDFEKSGQDDRSGDKLDEETRRISWICSTNSKAPTHRAMRMKTIATPKIRLHFLS